MIVDDAERHYDIPIWTDSAMKMATTTMRCNASTMVMNVEPCIKTNNHYLLVHIPIDYVW